MTHLLFDSIKQQFSLKNDAALADFIDDTRSSVSLIRSGGKKVNANLILNIHKATQWPVSAIEALIGAKESA